MRGMQVNGAGGVPALLAAEMPLPQPSDGEVLIQVRAAGATTAELHWYPTTHTKDGGPRVEAVPGHEFCGVVAAVGKNVTEVAVGQEIYGMNDWYSDGATAEFCVALPSSIAPKPASLSMEAAATVPIGALTAWQGLLDRAHVQGGERVLVHGGAGAVGAYAVQLAQLHGARVIATTSARSVEFVKQLGVERVIDYRSVRFEDEVGKVDVVFDAVGGETRARSWQVLKPQGRLVTVSSDVEDTAEQRDKDAFFIVEPNRRQLEEVGRLIDEGKLKTFVSAAVPLQDAAMAYSGTVPNRLPYGKVVITVSA